MSRIHEALKKVEAERTRASGEDIHGQTPPETCDVRYDERPIPSDAHVAEAVTEPRPVVTRTEFPPASTSGISGNLHKTIAPHEAGTKGSSWRFPHKGATCEPSLLEKCPRFDWAPVPAGMLVSNQGKYHMGAEEFRTLRSSIELVRRQQPLKTILVTSPLPKEGKTFVAVNLAQALGWQRERRVLLIDGDLRVSRVHACFGEMPQAPGLVDYLSGDVDPISLIRRCSEGNLFILPAGRQCSNALELIGNGRLKPLLEWLAPAFDWIVIDSPPSVPVSDARLIAESCEGVLFVLRAGNTPSDLAQRSLGQIRGKRYLGIVLNAVDPTSTASSYYYDGADNGVNGRPSS